MGVMRVHKNSNYTVMSNYHFKEKKMSLKSKGLLSLMLSLPDTWDYSVMGLVTLSKDGKDSVMSALSELESFGYLTRERLVNEKGQFAGVEYNIYEQPQEQIPNAEMQHEEKQHEENSHAENPRQLNTNSINHLKDELLMVLNTNDEELIELYTDFIKMRERMNSPLLKEGLHKVISKSKKLSGGNINVEKLILECSIINNWKDVYLPRESQLEALNQRFVRDFREAFGL